MAALKPSQVPGVRSLARHPVVAPAACVFVATAVAVFAASQPHGVASRLTLGFAAAAGALAVWWAWRRAEPGVGLRGVLVVAVGLRLLAVPMGPSLSDDAYRYVWDGHVQAEGINPYRYVPGDPAVEEVRERVPFDALNSPGYYSVYPPASQVAFRAAVWLAGDGADWRRVWFALKGLMLLAELAALLVLGRMVPGRAALVYAWHPLPVLEIAGQAHTEALMLPGLVLAAYALRSAAPPLAARATAGAALAWATLVKLVPVVLAPLALRKGRGGLVVGGAALGALLVWPYAASFVFPNVTSSLDLYVQYFEFNAGPYFLLKRLGLWATGEDVSKVLGPALRAVFLVGLLPIWAAAWRGEWGFAPAALVVWAWFFATSTTVHPWYLLGPLVLVPLVIGTPAGRGVGVAWAVLATVVPWTYALYAGLDAVYWLSVIAMWVLWSALLLRAYGSRGLVELMRLRGLSKWQWIARYLPAPSNGSRILDIGAGEGFVGAAAAGTSGMDVHLHDVVDLNRTGLPHSVGDGRTLPFASDSFDVALLVFVLHHAESAERVLEEAHRILVPGGRLAVLESVAETPGDDRLLHVLDPLANRIRSGGLMRAQEEHLEFRSAAAWRATFQAHGFAIEAEDRRGRLVHKRHLFVLVKR